MYALLNLCDFYWMIILFRSNSVAINKSKRNIYTYKIDEKTK